MKELFEHPSFKRFLALAALVTALAFVDDVVMTISFLLDGAYWAAAGRSLVFVLVGGVVALLWRAGSRHLETFNEAVQGQAEAERMEICESHGLGTSPKLGGVCMACRFEALDRRVDELERRERRD